MSDNQSLTLEEGTDLLSSDTQTGEHSEQPPRGSEQAEVEMLDADGIEDGDDPERSESQEEEPEEDDRPEWDKDDDDATDDKAEDGGRYASPKAKVKLPDGSEARVADLIENGLRHADYTRKAQEVAQVRQTYEHQFAGLQQLHQSIEQQQNLVLQFAQSRLPPPPTPQDWHEDPVGAGQRKAYYDQAVQDLQYLQNQMAGYQQNMTAQQQRAQWLAQQEFQNYQIDNLTRAMPHLRDPKKAAALIEDSKAKISEYYGASPDEVADIQKSWHVLALVDALKYRHMMKNRTDAQKNAAARKPKTAAPIAKSGRRLSGDEARQQSMSRVEESLGKKRSLSLEEAVNLTMARKRR
jgi:hypothetical protein